MAKQSVLEIFKKRTRHPFRPRAGEIISTLFPDFEFYKTPGQSLVAGSCQFLEKDLTIIAQQKPRPEDLKTAHDLKKLNYGMLTSDDHSFILSILDKLRRGDREKKYLFTIIDKFGRCFGSHDQPHYSDSDCRIPGRIGNCWLYDN